jgi:hypothetical protein
LEGIATGEIDKMPLDKMPVISSYVMIHWALDTTGQLEGYGFPFDCPHLVFYQRLRILYDFIGTLIKIFPSDAKKHKSRFRKFSGVCIISMVSVL